MPRMTGGKVNLNTDRVKYGKIKENCIVCVEDKSTDIVNAATVRENGHVWLSLCEEYFEILKDKEVMEEIKDVIMRAKTIKDNEKEKVVSEDRSDCGHCSGKFKWNNTCIQCIRCNHWIHLRCTQYKTGKEAEKKQETFLCKSCLILEDYYNSKGSKIVDEDENSDDNENINKKKKENTPSKSMTPTTSQRIDTLKLNINALTRTSWLLDSHIDLAIEDIQKYEKK